MLWLVEVTQQQPHVQRADVNSRSYQGYRRTDMTGLKPAVYQPGQWKLTVITSSVAKPQFHTQPKFTRAK